MVGRMIDNIYFSMRGKKSNIYDNINFIETDFGKIRVFDSGGNKPILINVPDAPNVIEHHIDLLKDLSKNFRVICFEYPGVGFSYPSRKYDYEFKSGAKLLLHLMDILKIHTASLIFSCSNGFYALQAATINPNKFQHIFICQTPSLDYMLKWKYRNIPKILEVPIIGQITNKLIDKKLAKAWYKRALPKASEFRKSFSSIAVESIKKGACFCLSSLVQGLKPDNKMPFNLGQVNVTQIWGVKDFSHRGTKNNSIREHVKNCEIIEFPDCGHFPKLENRTYFSKLVNERIK